MTLKKDQLLPHFLKMNGSIQTAQWDKILKNILKKDMIKLQQMMKLKRKLL